MGIIHCTSAAYMPQQNGKAEHSNCTILECALSMLCASNLSDGFWQDAVGTAVHLINQSTCTGLKQMTAEEAWSGLKPNISNLCVFGCPVYMLIPKELYVGKLAHKMCCCIFVGYSSTCKAWLFWNPVKHSIIKSREIVFNEQVTCCSNPLPPVDLSLLEYVINLGEDSSNTVLPALPVTNSNVSTSHPTVNPCLPMPLVVLIPPVAPMPIAPLCPPVVPQCCMNEVEHLYDFFEHHPLCDNGGDAAAAWIKGDLADNGLEQGLQVWLAMLAQGSGEKDKSLEDIVILGATTTDCNVLNTALSSIHKALQSPDAMDCIAAMHREMDSLTHSDMFIEVNQVPSQFTLIGSKFVFSLKKDINGKVIWYKACLVAQGFSQQEGINYMNTFAPAVRLMSIPIALAIATHLNLKMDHLNIGTTFLNGKINKEIHMKVPKGFEKLELDVGNWWQLQGSLYSLNQAPLIWNKLLNKVLKLFGWNRLLLGWCIYIWCDEIMVRLRIPGTSDRGQWVPTMVVWNTLILIAIGRVSPRD